MSAVTVAAVGLAASMVPSTWIAAATFSAGFQSGTVPVTPISVACGDETEQFAFFSSGGNPISSINLDNVGDSVQVQVCADDLTAGGVDTAQIVIEHDDSIVELIDPICEGLLSDGFVSPSTKRTADDAASAFICTQPGGVRGNAGAILGLTVRRTGSGTESLSFRSSGTLATSLYESGVEVTSAGYGSITVQQDDPSPTAIPTSPPVFVPPFVPPTSTPVPTVASVPAPPGLSFEPPTEPTDFVGAPGLNEISLSWAAPENSSGRSIDEYTLQNLRTGRVVRVDGSVLSYTFTDLDPSQFYNFTIKASTGLGVGPTTGVGPISPWALPSAPSNASSSVQSDGSTTLVSWDPPASDGGTPIIGYLVFVGPSSSGLGHGQIFETSGNEIVLNDLLSPGESFSISVAATTLAGTGPSASAGSMSAAETPALVDPAVTMTTTSTVLPSSTPVNTNSPQDPGSTDGTIKIDETETLSLVSVLEQATGSSLIIDEVEVVTKSGPDGIRMAIPVQGLSALDELVGSLNLDVGSMSLDVLDGNGTAEIQLANDIAIVGQASLTASNDELNIEISSPVLKYSPATVDDGSFNSATNAIEDVGVSFEVGVGLLPADAELKTTYSADPTKLAATAGTSFALNADDDLAYFVTVEKTGISQSDLGDNVVNMNVSLDWLDATVAAGKEIVITKVSDTGQQYSETAQCERLAEIAVCTASFTGAAGGFSLFAIYGSVNTNPQPVPQPLMTATPQPAPTPAPTAESANSDQAAGIATPTPPNIAPTPTRINQTEPPAGFSDDAESGNLLVFVIGGMVIVLIGGGALAVYHRRSRVSGANVLLVAIVGGGFAFLAGNSIPVAAESLGGGDDPEIRQLTVSDLPILDKNDFRFRKVSSTIRTLSEAYSDGTLDQWIPFSDLSESELLDPQIDVSIWFESEGDINLGLISQFATVLNHVGRVVEARVPVRFAHQLGHISGVLKVNRLIPPQPNVTSEGTTVHKSPAWNAVGLDGSGIKVGVIDTGFESWSSISPAELPPPTGLRCYTSVAVFTTDLNDCENGNKHGTAVAEAVDDIAPGVELYIANPMSASDMLATTEWMISQGVEIINHSVGWTWSGPGDGTSIITPSPFSSVDSAVAAGVLWVNASGNAAESNWYGGFSDLDSDQWVEISGVDELLDVSAAVSGVDYIEMRWEDSWSGATSDLDLYLYDNALNFVTASGNEQSGEVGHTPYESIEIQLFAGDRFAIRHFSGPAPNWIQLRLFRGGRLVESVSSYSIGVPAESANPGLLSVGAAPYTDTSSIESFSSRGPTTDGRTKPEIVGADGASSAAYGTTWIGTSLASPHVAGLAALVLQRFPNITPTELATYLKDNAADRGDAGVDNVWGHGFAELTAPVAPVAVADSYAIDEDQALVVPTPGVLINDSDDADSFTAEIVATPVHHSSPSFGLNSDGSFTYSPAHDFSGADSFTYRAVDSWQDGTPVTVDITINAVADISGSLAAQGVSNPNTVTASVQSVGSGTGTTNYPLGSDGSYDQQLGADSVTYTGNAEGYVSRTRDETETTADHDLGSTEIRAGDSDNDDDVDSSDITLLLAAFVAGLPSASSRDDGSGNTVDLNNDDIVDAIDISLWASNYGLAGPMAWATTATTPPLAISDSYWVTQDLQLSVAGSGVLGNDFDQEDDVLTAVLVDSPTHGSVTLNPDGSFTYDPDSGYVGADSFSYYPKDALTIGVKSTVHIDVRAPVPTATPAPGTTVGTTAGTTVGTTAGTTTGTTTGG